MEGLKPGRGGGVNVEFHGKIKRHYAKHTLSKGFMIVIAGQDNCYFCFTITAIASELF